jgi:hypothetical protein
MEKRGSGETGKRRGGAREMKICKADNPTLQYSGTPTLQHFLGYDHEAREA